MNIEVAGAQLRLPGDKPTESPQACVLFGKTMQEGIGRKDGSLHLSFTDGSKLVVLPDQNYEAWEASADDGFLVVSVPGGGLTTWSAKGKAKSRGLVMNEPCESASLEKKKRLRAKVLALSRSVSVWACFPGSCVVGLVPARRSCNWPSTCLGRPQRAVATTCSSGVSRSLP